jgi:phospholipid transport system transporter-binding protein
MSDLSIREQVIYLQGEVTYATVTQLSKRLHGLMQQQVRGLDCSGVTRVDSSITALLLVALKLANKNEADFSISQLPEAVSKLVKLYDLETQLGIAEL